jgi:hypothetical protein
MTALTRFLYPLPAERRLGSIILWWERRRVVYNAIVGLTGLGTLTVIRTIGHLPPFGHDLVPPLAPVLLYGVMANLSYTLGWVAEAAGQVAFGDELRPAGPILFRQGLIFSIGLTLMPIGIAVIEWGTRLLRFFW